MFCFNKKHHLRLVSVSCGCPFEADQLRFMGVMAAPYQPELAVSIWSDTYFIQFSLTVSNYNLKGYVRSIVCVVHIYSCDCLQFFVYCDFRPTLTCPAAPASCPKRRSTRSWPSCRILASTRSQIGSSTGRRTSRMVSCSGLVSSS
jgi:hypothetical protein